MNAQETRERKPPYYTKIATKRWHNRLNDENDGNGNGVDAIVCDYELFILCVTQKRKEKRRANTNERTAKK